jgi:subtilisin family serine protease
MIETKEYIVILEDGINYDDVWNDIENPTLGLPHIPDRAVAVVNNRDVQPRICHYSLTDDEAEQLKQDTRVLAVERPPEQIGLFPVPPTTFGPSTANVSFTIPAYNNASGNNVNWSLIRNSYANNAYGNNTTTSSEYNYVLDGTGVDVVIIDTGIEYYHPEFQDASGNTRIEQYNWTGTLDTSPNSINFRDTNGHGTASASLVAGKNYGWARNATIYPLKYNYTPGGIPIPQAIDAIITWHNAKNNPGNPIYTGRPTVVLGEFYNAILSDYSVTSINYRNGGEVAAGGVPDPNKGMGPANNLISVYDLPSNSNAGPYSTGQPFRVTATDTAIENMIAQGIIFIAAAGNNAHKIAQPTDASNKTNDYWNYWTGTYTVSGTTYTLPAEWGYYNRGASPATANSIVVGAMSVGLNGSSKNYKASFSNAGYNVTVFAPGWDVRSAVSNTTAYTTAPYWLNGSFKQTNFTGTSAACPQIAGMAALYLQAHPTAKQTEVKTWLTSNANTSIMYSTGQSDDYTNYQSQWGGNGGVAYQPIQGIVQTKDRSNTWKNVKDIQYKNPNTGQWESVKAGFTKTASGWIQIY